MTSRVPTACLCPVQDPPLRYDDTDTRRAGLAIWAVARLKRAGAANQVASRCILPGPLCRPGLVVPVGRAQ